LYCPVWAENYDWTLTQKNGQSDEKPNTWQPYENVRPKPPKTKTTLKYPENSREL